MRFYCLLLALAATLSAGPVAWAQGQDSNVTGIGTATLQRSPDLMRMSIQISVQASTAREALTKIKELETSARKKLADLGATEASIKTSRLQIGASSQDRQQQMNRMIRSRMGRAAPQPSAPMATAVINMRAEWPLQGSAEERALAAHELAEKVRAADLGGVKDRKLTPEEQEAMEEGEIDMDVYGQSQRPGEPMFVYVAKLSEEDRQTALADAFKKARDEASRLAKAAGAELGSIASLSTRSTTDFDYDEYAGYGGYGQVMRYLQQMGAGPQEQDAASEAIGNDPGQITHTVQVTGSFRIKQ